MKSGETSSHGSKLGLALRAVFRTPVLLYAAFASSAGFVLLNAVYTLNQAMFIVAGLPVAFWGAVVALALVIAAILSQQVDLIERKLGKTRVVVIATLVAAAGFALMALGSQPSVVGGFLLVILGWNSRGPVLTALVNTLVQSDVRATTLSIVSLLGSVVGVGLNPVIGWLADASPWLACLGIAGVTASLGVGWIPVMKHQDSLRAAHSSLTSESDGTGCD